MKKSHAYQTTYTPKHCYQISCLLLKLLISNVIFWNVSGLSFVILNHLMLFLEAYNRKTFYALTTTHALTYHIGALCHPEDRKVTCRHVFKNIKYSRNNIFFHYTSVSFSEFSSHIHTLCCKRQHSFCYSM